jgi:predicted Zn-dependent peptidase
MKHFRLKNGIPVILEQMAGTQVVTALILFKVGSRNETRATNGVSHFVEHLFFKGTEHRPTTLDISKELDGVGADFNAFTSKDFTGYYVKVSSRHTELAIDILEDILFHPIFDPAEIDRERGVIVEEINMYEDNPMAISDELSEQLMYGKDHPLGYRIAGPIKNIRAIRREAIIEYRDTYYHPDNMVVIVTGNLPKDIRQLIDRRFGTARRNGSRTPKQKPYRYRQSQARFALHRKKTAQAHLALTFPGPTYSARDRYAAELLSVILGGNMSSRLFINVRERQGLCYYIRAGMSPYEDCGAFSIQAGFDRSRINQAITAIIAELKRFQTESVTEAELSQAKEFLRGKTSLRLEDSESVAAYWGQQALFLEKPDWLTPQEYEKKTQAVTIGQLMRLARKTFQPKHANLVVIGPYSASQQAGFRKHLKF